MIVKNGKTIHLIGKDVSYIMIESEKGDLLHFYFGSRLNDEDYSVNTHEWERGGFITNDLCLDELGQEYPAFGRRDMRMPAYHVENCFGNSLSELSVQKYIIHNDAAAEIEGMPGLYKGDKKADTLEVILSDDTIHLEVRLYYTVFEEYNIIARNAVIINRADGDIKIDRAYSACLDMPAGDYDMIYFTGSWGNEANAERITLKQGTVIEAENARGQSHQTNPFIMIAEHTADEIHGEVYGFSLIYSGNHSSAAKVSMYGDLRVLQGINPFEFESVLKPGESFHTPQSVLCYSPNGIGELSREYHKVYLNNLMKSKYTHTDRPILINNWEATYFNFDEEKLVSIAEQAKQLGIELFVLDDGWFGKRNDDHSSLGDWTVNMQKLPSGIDGLADRINKMGMKFGLWFEPEMVNADSDLYKTHPDWCVRAAERSPVESRYQLVLDLTKDEVCEYIINAVNSILKSADISYVKWDFNRQITDMPYKGYNHNYTLGYYHIVKEITENNPDVLFEGCASGGGRFDPGVLAYMPQIWVSDNSDAAARMKMQYSLSMVYPIAALSNHVTASPNHQCGRITELSARADTAYIGTFGYELDLTVLDDKDKETIKEQIEFDKRIRAMVREGDFYRLQNPFESNYCAWQAVSKDRSQTIVYAAKILAEAHLFFGTLKLRGLDRNKYYKNVSTGLIYGGDVLMSRGIRIDYKRCDFSTEIILFEEYIN